MDTMRMKTPSLCHQQLLGFCLAASSAEISITCVLMVVLMLLPGLPRAGSGHLLFPALLLLLTVKQNESFGAEVIPCFGCLHGLVSIQCSVLCFQIQHGVCRI